MKLASNNVNELEQRLAEVWSGTQQNIVDTVVGERRKRFHVCVRTHCQFSNISCIELKSVVRENFHLSVNLYVFIGVLLTK